MKRIGWLLIMGFFLGTSMAQAGDYVAMVMDVDAGAVAFTGGEPVEVMGFLVEHDEVKLQDGAKVVILFFESSIREEITGPAVIKIGVGGSVSSAGIKAKIRKQTVGYLPPKAELDKKHHQNFGNIAFRKLGAQVDVKTQLVITSTSNTVYVPGAQPLLTWQVYPNADEFSLTVTGVNGSTTTSTTSSSITMGDEKQAPGRYTWVLEAKLNGKVVASRDGWYEIMTEDTFARVKQNRALIQDEYASGGMEEMAALSMLYQSYEMWNEMSLLLLALNKKQPENAEVIRKLRSINPHLLTQTDR